MLSVCHVSDTLSDAKVYKSIVTDLFKTKICALLLDFVFCMVKIALFPLQHALRNRREGEGMERRRDGNTDEGENAMARSVSSSRCRPEAWGR